MPYPAPGEPDLEMASWIILESVRPRPGKEVDAVLEYCKELAHVLLVGDMGFIFDPPGTPGDQDRGHIAATSSAGKNDVSKEMERAVALDHGM